MLIFKYKKRNQLQKLKGSRANLLNSYILFMGDNLILYFLIWVNVKQLRLQLNYPHVKLTAQLCAAPYTLLVPSGEQAPPFFWVLSGESNDMMSSENSARNNLDASTSANKPFLASIASPSLLAASR